MPDGANTTRSERWSAHSCLGVCSRGNAFLERCWREAAARHSSAWDDTVEGLQPSELTTDFDGWHTLLWRTLLSLPVSLSHGGTPMQPAAGAAAGTATVAGTSNMYNTSSASPGPNQLLEAPVPMIAVCNTQDLPQQPFSSSKAQENSCSSINQRSRHSSSAGHTCFSAAAAAAGASSSAGAPGMARAAGPWVPQCNSTAAH
jgi:hypothetical protein